MLLCNPKKKESTVPLCIYVTSQPRWIIVFQPVTKIFRATPTIIIALNDTYMDNSWVDL